MDFFHSKQIKCKQEVHHVAIFNDVIFTFSSHSGCLLRSLLNLTLNKLSVYPRELLRETSRTQGLLTTRSEYERLGRLHRRDVFTSNA